jgi:hypothetical protein
MAIFKIIGICIVITLVGCVIVYFSTGYGINYGRGANLDYTRQLRREGAVSRNWLLIFEWSLVILLGSRYLLKLYQWARKNAD